jgi:uncharacterized membrane protein YhhN
MARGKKQNWLLITFLLVEAALYALILAGQWVVSAQYAAVVLCVAFVIAHLRSANYYILGALLCTAAADWFLVVRGAADKVTAMLFFLAAQTLYAILLHRRVRSRGLVAIRVLAVVIVEAVTVLVLLGNMNELAAVSMAYYVMLAMNIVCAFKSYRKEPMMAWALVLFFICDTFIGLQIASGTFLILPTWLYNVVFCGFNVAWACYLPSQVMLALCGKQNRR